MLYIAISVLVLAWVIDGGVTRLAELIREPLVQGVLVFCGVWGLGLFWSDLSIAFQGKWPKYFILLTFIPLLSLMNKARLPWAAGALIGGYLCVVLLGTYQWLAQGMQGVPWLDFSYLGYSAALGLGVIILAAHACLHSSARTSQWLLSLLAFYLFVLQINQSSRGMLVATLTALLLLVVLRYRLQAGALMRSLVVIGAVTALIAMHSEVFQNRLGQAAADLQAIEQGDYQTSLGYRYGIWEIGLQGMAEYPWLGRGSGMAKHYLDESVATFQQGIYANLPDFQKSTHFHNEFLEIGVHLGLLGILAFMFLLWCWQQTLKRCGLSMLGGVIICFVIMAGLTHVFFLFNRVPALLLATTAILICWHRCEGCNDDVAAAV